MKNHIKGIIYMIIRKLYDQKLDKFIYTEEFHDGNIYKKKTFKSFDSFVKYLKKDLSGSELYGFDFKNVDLSLYDLTDVGIDKSVLIEHGLYNSSFYDINVGATSEILQFTPAGSSNLIRLIQEVPQCLEAMDGQSDYFVHYITDLHLDHKIKKKFPDGTSKCEIRQYIASLARELNSSVASRSSCILIGGDVSFNLEITKIFYEEFSKLIYSNRIIAILGNHELWGHGCNNNDPLNQKTSLENIIDDYSKMFSNLKISFIQNGLIVFKNKSIDILNEKNLNEMSTDEIRKFCINSHITIFGGIGFSGYNKTFNVTNGIYRDTISNLEEELIQTKKFEKLYRKIESAISDLPAIILTHMPKESWTADSYNFNWIYVSGHTHRDYCHVRDGVTVYGDNQVGYHGTSFHAKYFNISGEYDLFRDYTDGVYDITRDQYIDFYHGLSIPMQFNRKNCLIHMLKNSGAYCFILENYSNGNLSLMNGGLLKSLKRQDLSYFYDNLKLYTDSIINFLSDYVKSLKDISEAVKTIGGAGTIHGCIVDIDFFNHIYLNPLDGQVTPYFALNVTDKDVYQNIPSLLSVKRNDLYKNYKKIINSDTNSKALTTIGSKDMEIIKRTKKVCDTDIYRISRVFKGLEYTTNYNVVRFWIDRLLELNEEDRTRAVVTALLEKNN